MLASSKAEFKGELINAPNSGEYFLSTHQNEQLHCRYFVPDNLETSKAVVFWHHGLGDHSNQIKKSIKFLELLKSNGFIVVSFDQYGHGYSQGKRCCIYHYEDFVNDSNRLIDIFYKDGPRDTDHITIGQDVLGKVRSLKFFIGGLSMGGGLVFHLGLRLTANKETYPNFEGVLFAAPAITGALPPAPVVWILKNIVSPLFPTHLLPKVTDTINIPANWFTNEEDIEKLPFDTFANGGLGWGKNLRYITATQCLKMTIDAQVAIGNATFPFIDCHDPEDRCVLFDGSQMLFDGAKTTTDDRNKELVRMEGMKHDLLANCSSELCKYYVDWMEYRISR